MILVIRIAGQVGIPRDEEEALSRLRLRRKYAAALIKPTVANMRLLTALRNRVAYGRIDSDTLIELISSRAQPIEKNKKIDAKKIASEIENRSLNYFGLKPFFRLHPPRGGIDAKIHFGRKKGVLGDNKEKINDLVRRML